MHPDKGGSAAEFRALQDAYERWTALSDEERARRAEVARAEEATAHARGESVEEAEAAEVAAAERMDQAEGQAA